MYVGTLTADEIAFAGGKNSSNTNYYIMNTYVRNNSAQSNYLYWWSLSPGMFNAMDGDYVYIVISNGLLGSDTAWEFPAGEDVQFVARPAVTLKASTEAGSSGVGTKANPYVIN